MLYPNGQRALYYPARHVAGALPATGVMRTITAGERLNRTANFVKTASIPEGYAPKATVVMPVKAGGMSGTANIATSGEGSLLQGGPMVGNGNITFTPADASLGLIVSMSGNGTITFTTADATLALTMAMDGNGNITLTGSGGLSMIVPFEGNGNITFSGSADLKGRCSMQGEWTPYTELSPENLARAVWDALATQFNDAGTMGNKLNTASSGGVDVNALASAVLASLSATTIPVDMRKVNGNAVVLSSDGSIGQGADGVATAVWQRAMEDGMSSEQMLRIMFSALAGVTSGIGTNTERYMALDGVTPRIEATFDANNNRTSITLDGA